MGWFDTNVLLGGVMSVVYCEECDKYIDTDFNAEHFVE